MTNHTGSYLQAEAAAQQRAGRYCSSHGIGVPERPEPCLGHRLCQRQDVTRHEAADAGVPGIAGTVRPAVPDGLPCATAGGGGLQNPLGTGQSQHCPYSARLDEAALQGTRQGPALHRPDRDLESSPGLGVGKGAYGQCGDFGGAHPVPVRRMEPTPAVGPHPVPAPTEIDPDQAPRGLGVVQGLLGPRIGEIESLWEEGDRRHTLKPHLKPAILALGS